MTTKYPLPPQPRPPVELRKDGWPLCPICGEDEVISHLSAMYIYQFQNLHFGQTPPLADYMVAGMSCLVCGWQWEKPRK